MLVMCAVALVAGGGWYLWDRLKQNQNTKVVTLKLPAPNAVKLAKAEEEIRATLPAQVAGANRERALQAARDLLDRSDSVTDPAHALASLRVAAGIAATADDFSFANEICTKMDERFQINMLQAKLDMLIAGENRARSSAASMTLADYCIGIGFDALGVDDYERGSSLADMAQTAAQNSNNPRLIKLAAFLTSEMSKGKADYESAKPFLGTLQTNPEDPAANLAMGRYLCFSKNDWDKGLPMLARSGDTSLKNVVGREIRQTSDSASAQKAVGDLWWDLSAKAAEADKIHLQQRAKYWYQKAVVNSAEPEKSNLKMELNDRLKVVPTASAEVYIIARVGTTDRIDIYSDRVVWRSTGSVADRINQVSVDELKRGGSTVIKNFGATRYLPEGVDFFTARLVIDRKPRRRGSASLTVVAEDHVRVTLSDPPAGSSQIDVTVVFGEQK